jgi:hypothetical protein
MAQSMSRSIRLVGVVTPLAGTALFGVFVYVLSRLLAIPFITVLFYAYIVVGVFGAIISAFAVLALRAQERDVLDVAVMRPLSPGDGLAVVTGTFSRLLRLIATVAAGFLSPIVGTTTGLWAASKGWHRVNRVQLAARRNLFGTEHPMAVAMSLLAAGLFVWAGRTNEPARQGYWWFILVLANVWSRQLGYLLATSSLAASLRAGPGSPQLRFLVICAADLASLVLALTATRHWGEISKIGLGDFIDLVAMLLSPKDIAEALKGGVAKLPELLALGSGLLYATAMVKTVFKRDQFARTPLDYSTLALQHLCLGDQEGAKEWLLQTDEVSEESQLARCAYFLALGDFGRSRAHAGRSLSSLGVADTDEHAVEFMAGALVNIDVPTERALGLVEYALSLGLPERTVGSVCMVLIKRVDVSPRLVLELIMRRKATDQYPLTISGIQIQLHQYAKAREILESLRTRNAFEEALRRCLLLHAALEGTNGRGSAQKTRLEMWADRNLEDIKHLALQCESEQERKIVLRELGDAITFARFYESDILTDLEDVFRAVANSLPPNRDTALHARVVRGLMKRTL